MKTEKKKTEKSSKVHFSIYILDKKAGTLFIDLAYVDSSYYYAYCDSYNVFKKCAIIFNTKIGGIWDGEDWVYNNDSDLVLFKKLMWKYHNVQIT